MELMIYLLRAYGYEVLSATDGEAGLATAAKERPDMIICDVHLPQLDGYGVVRVLKRQPELRAIPTVAVTALAMVGDREKLLEAGFDGYISKPIDPETFIAGIAKLLPSDQRQTKTLSAPQRTVEPEVLPDEIETCLHQKNRRQDGDHIDR
jgi:CheY-like chemotaxis protein